MDGSLEFDNTATNPANSQISSPIRASLAPSPAAALSTTTTTTTPSHQEAQQHHVHFFAPAPLPPPPPSVQVPVFMMPTPCAPLFHAASHTALPQPALFPAARRGRVVEDISFSVASLEEEDGAGEDGRSGGRVAAEEVEEDWESGDEEESGTESSVSFTYSTRRRYREPTPASGEGRQGAGLERESCAAREMGTARSSTDQETESERHTVASGGVGAGRYPRYSRRVQSKSEPVGCSPDSSDTECLD
ncbi:hypothetical protein VTI74DRAFT_4888 [Chaetomium olivicolor]